MIATIPDDAFEYHTSQNHLSKWLYSRGLFPLAASIRQYNKSHFATVEEHRRVLVNLISDYRRLLGQGVVARFDPETYSDAVAFARLLIRCCEVTKAALEEFPNFRKSKKLKELLIEISDLEEEGDRQFIHAMRALHTDGSGPIEIIAWREIYIYLEKCADACEHVADVIESVVMKNS